MLAGFGGAEGDRAVLLTDYCAAADGREDAVELRLLALLQASLFLQHGSLMLQENALLH